MKMSSLMFGVISYLPKHGGLLRTQKSSQEEDDILRTKRKSAHRHQLQWINEHLPDVYKFGVYQGWDFIDFDDEQDSVVKERFETGIGPARARNVILNKFYNSDFDWLMMCDDDSWFYDYYQVDTFFQDLQSGIFDDIGIDAMMPLVPQDTPFKFINYTTENKNNWVLTRAQYTRGLPIIFLSNIVKRGRGEVQGKYFDEEYFDRFHYSEDILFNHDWIASGLSLYKVMTLIQKMECYEDSSLLGLNSQDQRKAAGKEAYLEIVKRTGFELVNHGGREQLSSRKVFNLTHSKYLVPRTTPIEFTEQEMPKNYVEKTRPTLFKVGDQ